MKRSRFLLSASALAAAAFLRETAIADAGSVAAPQFEAVVATVVPFGEQFPLRNPAELTQRIEALFHLGESAAFQASLAQFSSLESFSAPSPQLFAFERAYSPEAQPEELLELDRHAFARSALAKGRSFADLTPEQRAAYLRLWTQSAFIVRRRFYMSVRAIAFEAFYSMPQVWNAIGYAGPMLEKGRRA